MAAISPPRHLQRPSHRRVPSGLDSVPEDSFVMSTSNSPPIHPQSKSEPELRGISDLSGNPLPGDSTHAGTALLGEGTQTQPATTPSLSQTPSYSASIHSYQSEDESSFFPPVERITMFDFVENLALQQRVEKWQASLQSQADKFKRQQSRLKGTGMNARDRVVEEWRRRVPTPDEQLDKYRARMRKSVDRLHGQWKSQTAVTAREKASFIAGVLNIFISGYLIGAFPQYFPHWYTGQMLYFMPIRFYTYKKKEYHYFLADLCYFVNLLLILSIWVFPSSKRLFISSYCLAYGNNAVAIAMWRNSLVFHSMDKVVSLFIHIMPPVTLHCLVHLLSPEFQRDNYPAIYTIRFSAPGSPEHYTLFQMMLWATFPYAFWQLSYHFGITVRKREKIAAGRLTSFVWLRKSYAKTWIGKIVLSLPDSLQEPAFMLIQYSYAVITMLPCPIWFWYRWPSGLFLVVVFIWSIYNGATFYIDFYGKKFQKELEALKKDVAKWQNSPVSGLGPVTPGESTGDRKLGEIEALPSLEGATETTGAKAEENGQVRERK
ncbi:hypothetical protein BU24DRAFT_405009 [Aaosphaeria arxii CBS 175.79]|uniref:Glycerophosphocholine acyltransferase 1 n=1 Tax=Aaosphaeria arxii CBS 175.79 TaxID=1450172 RepID=A0A6A5YBV8_9PLEO|nr:uncharacterized protein BU24DRAFT_405009 [Aaosphaeria arxii CBS 175.79]KAF2022104.1 hypothetical protein BU24DRAFT_405009 [Aaosphaeria arxii CBS 175.79]